MSLIIIRVKNFTNIQSERFALLLYIHSINLSAHTLSSPAPSFCLFQ